MAHGVLCKKKLDTNDEYLVSLCWEMGGGGGVLKKGMISFYRFSFLAFLLLQDRDALLFDHMKQLKKKTLIFSHLSLFEWLFWLFSILSLDQKPRH